MTDSHDPKDWPELQSPHSAEQAFAEALVRKESAEAHQLLVKRVGMVQILVVVLLLSAGDTLWTAIPQLWRGNFDAIATLLGVGNAVLAVSASGYFLCGKDPDFGASVAQLLLIIYGLEILMSLEATNLLLGSIVTVVVLFLTYRRLRSLRTHWL
jgi:hypothetical protein